MEDERLFAGLDKRIKAALKRKRSADKRLDTIAEEVQSQCKHPVIYRAEAENLTHFGWLNPYYVCKMCGAHESGNFPKHLRPDALTCDTIPISRRQAYALRLGPNRNPWG